jgi:hypothetical protein
LRKLRRDYPAYEVVAFSAVKREGRQDVLTWIDRATEAWMADRPASGETGE